jgi:hypothetical protein
MLLGSAEAESGGPRTYANADQIRALRAQNINAKQGIGTGTAVRAAP